MCGPFGTPDHETSFKMDRQTRSNPKPCLSMFVSKCRGKTVCSGHSMIIMMLTLGITSHSIAILEKLQSCFKMVSECSQGDTKIIANAANMMPT